MVDQGFVSELSKLYRELRPVLESRTSDFRTVWQERNEKAVLSELKFCLLTPQSKALSCWAAVERMGNKGVCKGSDSSEVEDCLKGVRFHHNKARYLLGAMERFEGGTEGIMEVLERFGSARDARDWLTANVKGLGLKEASHFLRNIGYKEDLAILDRHILKNLVRAGVLPEVPRSMTRQRYLDIEKRMMAFSGEAGIPMSHLDLLLWYRQTGCVFK